MANLWIDLDNAPHVPFFVPIIDGLRERGHDVLITVREYGYTCDLADRADLDYDAVGRHPGGNKLRKVLGLGDRVSALLRWARGRRIDAAVSHGSRALVIAAWLRRIPCVTMYDYEFVSTSLFNKLSRRVLLPELVPDALIRDLGLEGRAARYPGLKEEVYLGRFVPQPALRTELGINGAEAVVVIRPPATSAHYHNPKSEAIMDAFFEKLAQHPGVHAVVVPRTARQAAEIAAATRELDNVRVLTEPVDGLNLIWNADLVVGGGGTMNREAAMLGVPVYSMFMGRAGAIDRSLAERGKLTFVKSIEDVERIPLVARTRADEGPAASWGERSRALVDFIVHEIESVITH